MVLISTQPYTIIIVVVVVVVVVFLLLLLSLLLLLVLLPLCYAIFVPVKALFAAFRRGYQV